MMRHSAIPLILILILAAFSSQDTASARHHHHKHHHHHSEVAKHDDQGSTRKHQPGQDLKPKRWDKWNLLKSPSKFESKASKLTWDALIQSPGPKMTDHHSSSDEWLQKSETHKTNFSPYTDSSLCDELLCKRKQICLINADTGKAECVYKKMLKTRRKLRKYGPSVQKFPTTESPTEDAPLKGISYHTAYTSNGETLKNQVKYDVNYVDNGKYMKKVESVNPKSNSVFGSKSLRECTRRDLDEMGHRLLDWFKLLQDNDLLRNSDHHKVKRNSKKRELRDGDCGCQSPVMWQFQQLDHDMDGRLSKAELQDIENNLYEHCVTPFLDNCDANGDQITTEQEWCCCFSDILPPCQLAQKRLLPKSNTHRLGFFIPECDEDGFYKQMQCQARQGECWCVDRNGHEIPQSRVKGHATCDDFDQRRIGNRRKRR